MNRRDFLNTILLGTAGSTLLSAKEKSKVQKLTILHTNDTHSHIDPFPSNHQKYPNAGGINARKLLIDKIRSTTEHVLLLDAGDIFQGTPYFNLYNGAVELKAMSLLKYDAATMGNHDFDAGLGGFKTALKHADFPFICSNYDFTDTILNGETKAFTIVKKGGLKIGIIGLGVALEGLVNSSCYGQTKYLNPMIEAQKHVNFLREKSHCNLVICLSHLGYKQPNEVDDIHLAKKTHGIDLIIGGHTHTLLNQPELHTNALGKKVLINQVGWAGLHLGRVDFYFDTADQPKLWSSHKTLPNISV